MSELARGCPKSSRSTPDCASKARAAFQSLLHRLWSLKKVPTAPREASWDSLGPSLGALTVSGPSWEPLGGLLGPLGGLMGFLWDVLEVSWGLFGSLGGLLGHLGVSREPLGNLMGPLGASRGAFGASWGAPVIPKGCLLGVLGSLLGSREIPPRAHASPAHPKGSVE